MIPRPYLRKGVKVQFTDELKQKYPKSKDSIFTVIKTYHQWVYVTDSLNNELIFNCDDLQGITEKETVIS